jgi:anti-anti-sigma factor
VERPARRACARPRLGGDHAVREPWRALKSELIKVHTNGERNLVLDVSECDYCDSSGLSAILVANRLCEDAMGTFVLTGLQRDFEQIIRISMLHTVLVITKTAAEAAMILVEKGKQII